jgi:nitroreductase
MMDALEAVFTRRSVRQYTDEPVSDQAIETILRAATQNLLLAAHAIGLGAVWLGVYPRRERIEGLRRLLQLPDNLVPLNIVSLGHPVEPPAQFDRFDPSRVSRNIWPGA